MSVWHTTEKGKPIVSMHEQDYRDVMARIENLTRLSCAEERRANRYRNGLEAVAGFLSPGTTARRLVEVALKGPMSESLKPPTTEI